jgi:hypothetical protein
MSKRPVARGVSGKGEAAGVNVRGAAEQAAFKDAKLEVRYQGRKRDLDVQ